MIGKYNKIKERVREAGTYLKFDKQKLIEGNDKEYGRKLMKFMDKNRSSKKEQHDITDMHEIEHITEEIEKGKGRK